MTALVPQGIQFGGLAHPVNLLLRMNLHERVAHPAFLWRGGSFPRVNQTPRSAPRACLGGRPVPLKRRSARAPSPPPASPVDSKQKSGDPP
jgi:hypothetical protein